MSTVALENTDLNQSMQSQQNENDIGSQSESYNDTVDEIECATATSAPVNDRAERAAKFEYGDENQNNNEANGDDDTPEDGDENDYVANDEPILDDDDDEEMVVRTSPLVKKVSNGMVNKRKQV